MPVLLLSDLHLSLQRPAQLALFKRLLAGPARRAEAVYILGDLFEHFWLGDDDHTPPVDEVMAQLRACAAENPRLFFLRGNRDLMAGEQFTQRSGCRLLTDEAVIELNGQPALLMHGDLLCSRDVAYQRFRRLLEMPLVRRCYLSLPYALRARLAQGLRTRMKGRSSGKPQQQLDVDTAAVTAAMQRHRVSLLIHGHTHRPAVHEMTINGRAVQRIVLGDWYGQGQALVCEGGQRHLAPIEELLR